MPPVIGMLLMATSVLAAPRASASVLTPTSCTCTDNQVCGTGTAGDPFRCCDQRKDSCDTAVGLDPCKPWRCSVEPSCCVFLFELCSSDVDCGGRPGSCDLNQQFCTAPCPPSVNNQCGFAPRTCLPFGGSSYQVPDGTACDDGRLCSSAQSPPPSPPVACTMGIGGVACTRDRALTDIVNDTGDCPVDARICSGSGSTLGGQGGAIVNGRCCPEGTACDPITQTCRGNFGAGTNINDMCISGTCTPDSFSGCPPTSGEAAGDGSLRASITVIEIPPTRLLQLSWAPACNATGHLMYWGTSPIAGRLTWTGSVCALAPSSATFGPGTPLGDNPPAGTFRYFVVVGSNASSEGTYGKSSFFSNKAERPDAVSVGSCDLPRVLNVCP